MAPSDDTKLVESCRDFMTVGSQYQFELPADSKYARYSLRSVSLSIRQLCIVGTLFVILMGILSSAYLDLALKVMMEQSFHHAEFHPKYHSVIDAAGSDRSLKIFEEFSVNTSSSPNETASRESAQEAKSSIEKDKEYESTLLEEKNDDKHVKDGLVGLPVPGQADIQQGEEKSTVEQVQVQEHGEETNMVNVSPTDSGIEVYRSAEKEKGIELVLAGELQQNGSLGESGKDEVTADSKEAQSTSPAETILQTVDSSATKPISNSSAGECDVTVGKWIHEPAGPLYGFDQCKLLSAAQNCEKNGRPDKAYEFYKWEPDQCSLPRFDANAFLELMRGKTVAFVGDSLARNQMESLMCILLQVTDAKSKGSKNMHKWYFPSHQFTVVRMWSSWLVRSDGDFPPSLVPPDISKLNLTELDDYAEHLPRFDVTILSSGHWWLRKSAYFLNGELLGGVGFPWLPIYGDKKLNHTGAYEIALSTAMQKLGSYPGYKGLTILRTYTPDHYSGGSWDTGGSCTGETKPYEEAPRNLYNEMMLFKQLSAFQISTRNSRGGIMPNGSKLRLLDTYSILNYRGDGHPGPFRSTDPLKQTTRDSKGRPPPQDCLHWCMPGPVDTMNELLFHMLRKEMS